MHLVLTNNILNFHCFSCIFRSFNLVAASAAARPGAHFSIVRNITANVIKRAKLCVQMNGGHFEHLLPKKTNELTQFKRLKLLFSELFFPLSVLCRRCPPWMLLLLLLFKTEKTHAAIFKTDPVHIVIASKIKILFVSTKCTYVFYDN